MCLRGFVIRAKKAIFFWYQHIEYLFYQYCDKNIEIFLLLLYFLECERKPLLKQVSLFFAFKFDIDSKGKHFAIAY